MKDLNHVSILDLYTTIVHGYRSTPKIGWLINVARRKSGTTNAYPVYFDVNKQFISRARAYELLSEQLDDLEKRL